MIIALTTVIVAFLGLGGLHQMRQVGRYQDSIEELSSEVSSLKETNKALEEEKARTSSDEFKEHVAREKLGLVEKDEYVVREAEEDKTGQDDSKKGNAEEEDDTSEEKEEE